MSLAKGSRPKGGSVLLLLACAPLALAAPAPEPADRLVDLVRPIVGTARKDQRIGAVNSGQTFPAVGVPFGMTHWTPQTQASEDKCVAPFYAQDERIQGIRASHWWSGSCTHDYGSATVAAIVGPLRPGAEERGSRFSRQDEVMTPAYYAVTLPDHGVRVEVTGTARGAVLRFTFLRGGEASLLVHANRKTRGAIPGGLARVDAARRTIAVSNPVQRIYAGSGRAAGFSGHLVARTEVPFEGIATSPHWEGEWRATGIDHVTRGAHGTSSLDVHTVLTDGDETVMYHAIGRGGRDGILEGVTFETASERLAWLNDAVAVGRASLAGDELTVELFRVTT